jgi:hypothetical protein
VKVAALDHNVAGQPTKAEPADPRPQEPDETSTRRCTNRSASASCCSTSCPLASRHQPDLFATDNDRRQKLSPLVDRINDRYGRCAVAFGLFPPGVWAFKGHAAFHRVPEKWEF